MSPRFTPKPSFIRYQLLDDRRLLAAAALLSASILLIGAALLLPSRAEGGVAAPLQPIESTPAVVTLLAPTRTITAGSSIEPGLLRAVRWPVSAIPDDAVRDRAEIRGRYAVADLPAGVPLTRMLTVTEPPATGLQPGEGKRLVTIEVDAQTGVERWASPGAVVDVILNSTVNGQATAAVLVERAVVRSRGGDSNREVNPAIRTVEARTTVTLETSFDDALRIEVGKSSGRLTLFMRPPNEIRSVGPRAVSLGQIKRGVEAPVKSADCGRVRAHGEQFILGCDGKLRPVDE